MKFTYDFFMDIEALKNTGGTSSLNQYVEKIEIDEEENSITFTLKEIIFTIDASVFSASILDSTLIERGALDSGVAVQQYVKANISQPIGYGPYKIVEYVESQFVKLEINGNYVDDV